MRIDTCVASVPRKESMRKQLCPLLGALVLASMAYAGWLTSDWRSLLSCAPAILMIVVVVAGLTAGVMFFGTVEEPTVEAAVALAPLPILARLAGPDGRSVLHRRTNHAVPAGW